MMSNKYINLNELLIHGHEPSSPAVIENGIYVTWEVLKGRINNLKTVLEKHAGHNSRWLLFSDSSLNFSAGLLGCWASQNIAVLPPDIQKGSILETSENVEGIITDSDTEFDGLKKIDLRKIFPQTENQCFKKFNPDASCLELFTSGSTGKRKSIPKNFSHLSSEIDALQKTWGKETEKAVTYSTVSHQHIYGLLHKILWPLCAGRVFDSKTWFFPETLISKMKTEEKTCLVSSPAHLKRIVKLTDLSDMKNYCSVIFSSGGLLDNDAADLLRNASGITAKEILGSTETGGVAWRAQTEDAQSRIWKPLKDVSIKETDQCLTVKSPFTSVTDGNGWFFSKDKIDMLDNNRFHLLGRADRIVKIEEKRISLNDIEKRLDSHEFIKKGRAFTSNISKNDTNIKKIAAAVELTAEGGDFLEKNGRRGFIKNMRKYLLPCFTTVAVPRYWRIVDKIPEDSQGKTTEAALEKLL